MIRPVLLALGLQLAATTGSPAQAPAAALDSIFDAIRRGPPGPALGMIVVQRGRVVYRSTAGYADLERMRPAAPAQRFDVASIAKQFTAFAISILVEQGLLAPEDPVSRYLPELRLGGTSVTIRQLLDHTSGIEDIDGLLVLAGGAPDDQVGFGEALRPLLAQEHLRFNPGEAESYGNGGYVLLAEIVQRVTHSPFASFADSMIFAPLGMRHSEFLRRPDVLVPDRAVPYQRNDSGGLELSRVDAYPGPGGMYTTLDDMARWLLHLLKPGVQSAATLRLRERGRLNSGEALSYGWGLASRTYRGHLAFMHSGTGAATEAQMLVIPDLDFGVFSVAAGPTGQNPTTLAYRAADLFLAGHLGSKEQGGRRMMLLTREEITRRPAESEGVTVPPERLRRLAGRYRIGDGPILVIRVSGDHLELGYDGRQPYLPLFPLPDGRFVQVPLWEAYRFDLETTGPARTIFRERTPKSMQQDLAVSQSGTRLPDPPPFDSAAAAPYAGVYCSEELGACYQVVLVEGSLVLRHPRLGSLRLEPLIEDKFGLDSQRIVSIRFARAGDPVIGMELEAYSWGARAAFTKVSGD